MSTTVFEKLLVCRPVNKMSALHVHSPCSADPLDMAEQEELKARLINEYREKFFIGGRPTMVLLDLIRRNEKLRRAGKPEEPLPHLDPLGFHATCVARNAHHDTKFKAHVERIRRRA